MKEYKYPKPFPGFVFYAWAHWCGESVAAEYMAADGYISQRRAKVIIFFADIFAEILSWFWWWTK